MTRALPYLRPLPQPMAVPLALARIGQSTHSFCLDAAGRYTFLGHRPVATFASYAGLILRTQGATQHQSIDAPVAALRRFAGLLDGLPVDPYLPFYGGLVGFVSFEWGANVARPGHDGDASDIPDTWFGLFDTVLVIDHIEHTAYIASLGLDDALCPRSALAQARAEQLAELLCEGTSSHVPTPSHRTHRETFPLSAEDLTPVSPRRHYQQAARTIQQHLWQGVAEKVNLAPRYVGLLPDEAWAIHARLREDNPTPYGMFLNVGAIQFCSASPTCFLKLQGRTLVAKPVLDHRPVAAGETMPEARAWLAAIPGATGLIHRLQAELAPLTTPAIQSDPPRIETDTRAHHLTCSLRGTLQQEQSFLDALALIVPGLSMTGFPKDQAIRLLHHHEPCRRHAYTGAMGYWGPQAQAQFNLSVRLLTIRDGLGYLHAASWIDPQHDPVAALHETDTQVAAFFSRLHHTPIGTIHEQSLY